MNYHFELVQEVTLQLYMILVVHFIQVCKIVDFVQFVIRVYCSDGRSKQQDLDNHTFLGETRAILSNLMCASNQLLCSDLTGGRETLVFFIV